LAPAAVERQIGAAGPVAKYASSTVEFAEMVGHRGEATRAMAYHFARRLNQPAGVPMSKEQRATKNTKKPKKDAAVPKAAGSDRPTPPMTSVAPKGKLAKKPA
jgi:hypothetical protein